MNRENLPCIFSREVFALGIKKQIRVMKFGGTSVADAECYRRAADLVARAHRSRATVTIVSAMSGITNALVEAGARAAGGEALAGTQLADMLQCRHSGIAHALVSDELERRELQGEIKILAGAAGRICDEIANLKSPNARLVDALCGIGERLSARLFAAALAELNTPAIAIDATTLVVTSDDHGEAEPDLHATRARVRNSLRPLLSTGVVPVITGFIGATPDGIPTTLGRGGSDYSATIIAAALDAESVVIWTDVDGVMTADPKLVPGARTISELSYREATTFAQAGAKVIHPKTLRPVAAAGIPVQIRNTFSPGVEGTWVTRTPTSTPGLVTGIAAKAGDADVAITLLAENGTGPEENDLKLRIENILNAAQITYSFSESRGVAIVLVSADDLTRSVQILHDEFDLSSEREQNPGLVARLRGKTAACFGTKQELGSAARRYNLALSRVPGA